MRRLVLLQTVGHSGPRDPSSEVKEHASNHIHLYQPLNMLLTGNPFESKIEFGGQNQVFFFLDCRVSAVVDPLRLRSADLPPQRC